MDPRNPNIVVILADDLGYGDVGCYNPDSQIQTPNIDSLATGGRRFTDAHAPAAVCTPSRYGLLTGRYCWRSRLPDGIVWHWDPPLIREDRLTLPELLGTAGYDTACIGKWHLGWEWPTHNGGPPNGPYDLGEYDANQRSELGRHVDFSEPIPGGPTDRGFDYYFGDDVPNFPPYTWIENDRILKEPTVDKPEDMHGLPGPMAREWVLEAVMPELTARYVEYVTDHAESDDPFFLYAPLTAPHTPVVPVERFQGGSDAGSYGDYVTQIDWTVGQVVDALVIVTSDNGPEDLGGTCPAAYHRIREYDHHSTAGLRGIKRDLWEGGHRVPFVAHWPDEIPAGTLSTETICLTDLFRTCASLVGSEVPPNAGEDSYDILPALSGNPDEPIRGPTVYHGVGGELAIRQGDWVYIDHPTGGPTGQEPAWYREEFGYEEHEQPGELFDLSADREQRENLYAQEPERVDELASILNRYREQGRSVPPSAT